MMKRWFVMVMAAAVVVSCSTATKTVATAGSLATKTVATSGKLAGQTTKTAVTTSGKVVATTVTTTVKTTAGVVGGVAKTAFVTFKDTATGVTKQIPWTEGMKLYAASKTAEVDLYLKAFQIVRNGGAQVIKSDWNKIKTEKTEPVLQPGDVIEVTRMAAEKSGKRI